MANFLPLETVRAIYAKLGDGASIRAIAAELGISTNTVKKYRKPENVVMCECGKRSDHKGWCKVRYAKSHNRQAFHANRGGANIEYIKPERRSRAQEGASLKRHWLGVGEELARELLPPTPAIQQNLLTAIASTTKRLPTDFREDVRQSMILSALEGRLFEGEIKTALPTFLFYEMRGRIGHFGTWSLNEPIGPQDSGGKVVTFEDRYGAAEWWQSAWA